MTAVHFSKDHEYLRAEGDVAVIGVSDYAQAQLGDIVFVELPAIGKHVKKGEALAVIESVKAASEVYSPVSGEVVAVNDDLASAPATVNEDPMSKGWLVKLRLADTGELASLMDQSAYDAFVKTL
jgi:glycine cleavage system H protein